MHTIVKFLSSECVKESKHYINSKAHMKLCTEGLVMCFHLFVVPVPEKYPDVSWSLSWEVSPKKE